MDPSSHSDNEEVWLTSRAEEVSFGDQELLANLMEMSPDLIYFKDRNSRLIRVNNAYAAKYGIAGCHDLHGKTDFDFCNEEHARDAYADEQQIIATGQSVIGKIEKEIWPDGRVTWVSTSKLPLRNAQGEIVGITGISRDVTDKMESELTRIKSDKLFQSVFKAVNEGLAMHRLIFDSEGKAVDYQILAVNPAFERDTGLKAQDAVNQVASELYGVAEPPFLDVYAEVARTGVPQTFETFFPPLQRHFSISASSSTPGEFVTVFLDISARKKQEAQVRHLTRLYAVLSQVNQAVVHATSEQELLQQVCDVAIQYGEFQLAWVGEIDFETGAINPVASAGGDEAAMDYMETLTVRADDTPEGRGPGGLAAREGRTCICNDLADDPSLQPWWEGTAKAGLNCLIALPVKRRGVTSGIFCVYAGERNFFQPKEVALLEEVAGDISFALDHQEQEARRRQVEISLLNSEEEHRLLIDRLQSGVVVHAPDTSVLLCNFEASRLLGLQTDQVLGSHADGPLFHFYREDGSPMPVAEFPVNRVIATAKPLSGLVLGIGKDEESITWVLVNAYPEFREDNTLRQVVVTFAEITKRKRAEEDLKNSEEKFRSLFATSRDAILLINRNGCFDCNAAALTIFGAANTREFIGKELGQLSAPTQPDGRDSLITARACIENTLAFGSQFFEWVHQRFDGPVFPAEVSLARFDLNGEAVIQAVVRDISWRKAAEQQLRQLSRAVEQSPCTVVITDTNGKIEYVNPKFTAVTGYRIEEVVGHNPSILKSGKTPAEVYQNLWSTIKSGREWRGEFQCKKKNGDLIWESASICPLFNESGKIIRFLAVKEDITDRKRMEENMLHAQRLESIGSLAGGIAHDLNNILAPIMMSASMLNSGLPEKTFTELVATIEEAAQRGADIVRQVLTFARGVDGRRVPLNPAVIVSQVARIVRETFPKSVAFEVAIPKELWHITGDLTQLHQVLLNFCVNARDAMSDGGVLRMVAENCEFDQHTALLSPDAKPGRYVKLEVLDSGAGIPPEIIDRIFEPFFTTKEPGKGTGLGLSTALGIVRSHGGFLAVQSELNSGAAFQMYIPALAESELVETESEEIAAPVGNGELILVVDDEPEILKVTRTILTRGGYEVITAGEGSEALALYADNAARIRMVVTDWMMPLMDGARLIHALKELNPALPIAVASGYGDESAEAQMTELGVQSRLGKPFRAEQLLRMVHDVIHRND